MSGYRYQALGPLLAGEGSRAFLGLAIAADHSARPVVIIWVPDAAQTDSELLGKIRRESEHAAKLDHPNIVTVFGFAKLDEGHARVVEFADGESLRKALDTAKKLPPRIAARIIADACTGTHYAHVAGNDDGSPLVHGDLRPETLLISFNGVTKVTGYGALAFAPRELGGQRVKGRRVYSAPEQIIGGREAISVPTDVYLLGLALYECLTGVIPWADQGDFFDHAVLTLPLPPGPPGEIPPELEGVIAKACAKKASDRYPTPLAMREAIEAAMGSELASTEELAKFLEELFPQSHQLRADRRHTIDAGIADLVRRQWAQKDAAPAEPTRPQAAPGPAAPGPAREPGTAPASKAPDPRRLAAASQEVDEEPRKDEGSSLPWVILLALFIAVIAGWWAWKKAHEPIPGVETPAASEPPRDTTGPGAKADAAGAPEPAAAQGATSADAAASDAVAEVAPPSADAGTEGTGVDASIEVDAGSPAAPVEAPEDGGAGEDAGTLAAAPAEVEVQISSSPSAELSLEGQSLGKTPWSGRLSPGRKVFHLENKAVMLNAYRGVTVKAEPVSESFTFEKGSVSINAPAGAVVSIDGVRIGTAPISGEVPVYEGSHRITVTYSQAKWSEPFTLRPKERVSFNVEQE